MSLVQELNSKTLVLWRGNKFAFIRVYVEVLTGIDQGKVFCALDNQEYNILDVENKWRSPVHNIVDIALAGCADYQVVVLHAHVHNSFSKVKVVIHFVKAIIN